MFEVSLADLQNDEEHAYRKIRLRAEDVQGRNVLTNFWVGSKLFIYCCCYRDKFDFQLILNSIFIMVFLLDCILISVFLINSGHGFHH